MATKLAERSERGPGAIAKPGGARVLRAVLRIVGGGLLLATGAIHLDLYLTGYRTIPTIGGLFLLQVITAFALGGIVLLSGSRLVAAAGAGFCLATLGGYLVSLRVDLFGFREVRTNAGIWAGVIEILGFLALGTFAVMRADDAAELQRRVPLPSGRVAVGAVVVLAVAAAAVLVVSENATSATGSQSGSHVTLRAASVGGVKVVTNTAGFTLYWFVPDTPTTSNCNGTCAVYWPPVTGRAQRGPGVTGTLGTIRRSDGRVQVTYDGHPLYAYIGDTAAGQANGNNINLNGGVWHEMAVSG